MVTGFVQYHVLDLRVESMVVLLAGIAFSGLVLDTLNLQVVKQLELEGTQHSLVILLHQTSKFIAVKGSRVSKTQLCSCSGER